MPTIIFDTREEIPEKLRDQAQEKDGKFTLDAQGVLNKNKELLADNSELKTKVSTLTTQNNQLMQDKTRLESGQLPDGKVAVEPEIEKLGNAAKAAGLKQSELSELKTKVSDLSTQIDAISREKSIDLAAQTLDLNEKFKVLAKEKALNFEVVKEGEGKDAKEVAYVLGADNAKTKLDEFLQKDAFFSPFLDTFKSEDKAEGFEWIKQESGHRKPGVPSVQQEEQALLNKGIYGL